MQIIDPDIQETNIDHIIPLANKGKDEKENFAVTHSSCNKSKQNANLKIARVLHNLQKIQDDTYDKENRSASLKNVLDVLMEQNMNLSIRWMTVN